MIKEFYELEVWKMGKILIVQIYKLTRKFPKQETYGLVDQLRRAANSICRQKKNRRYWTIWTVSAAY